MGESKRTLKGLLLEMKISDNSEMRIMAEETIVNMFHDLETELAQLKEKCAEYETEITGDVEYLDTKKILERWKGKG